MKKITFFVATFVLAFCTSNASEINFSGVNSNSATRFDHNEPIQFSERGIDFFVFPNGEFDFNTRPEDSNGDYYFKTAGRRSVEANNNNFENFGVRIERDNFGRIRRIGNTFINYDFQDRVSRIGSVFLRYNRFTLVQIGGLQLVYNQFGELIDTFGCVKTRNFSGFVYSNNNGSCNNNDYPYYGNNSQNDNQYYFRGKGKKEKKEKKYKDDESKNDD